MFLSRVEVAWTEARNPYQLHRAVWSLFPGAPPEGRKTLEEERSGFLFRVERSLPGQPALLLVQSRHPPRPGQGTVTVMGTREFQPQPTKDQHLWFLLTANPIKTIADREHPAVDGTGRRCRVPLIREEEQKAWLVRKLAGSAAIQPEAVQVLAHPALFFRQGGRQGKLALVTFQGPLQVTDPVRLCKNLEDGIGPAKGFGGGLLLVRRP